MTWFKRLLLQYRFLRKPTQRLQWLDHTARAAARHAKLARVFSRQTQSFAKQQKLHRTLVDAWNATKFWWMKPYQYEV